MTKTMTTTEIRERARRVSAELEALRDEVEHSSQRPEVKSSMAREICESQARVRRVLQVCDAADGAAVLAPTA